jgi:hypothetical protein
VQVHETTYLQHPWYCHAGGAASSAAVTCRFAKRAAASASEVVARKANVILMKLFLIVATDTV